MPNFSGLTTGAGLAQAFGMLLYAAAVGAATPGFPIPPQYAPYLALIGGILRTFTNSNANVTPPPAPPAPPAALK